MVTITTILAELTHANRGRPLKSPKLRLCRALFLDHDRLPRVHLRLLFLFFDLFLFFNFNFIAGSINTDKCTVPSDGIVDSRSKLLSTPKPLIIDGLEARFVRRAPEGSFLHRISRKTLFEVNSLRDLDRVKADGISRYVMFDKQRGLVGSMSFLAEQAGRTGSVAFTKTSDYERLAAFRMRRSLDNARKRFINSR